jgi:hypothetical protein
MRYWCAGNPQPPPMALRALSRRVAHRLAVRETIQLSKRRIEMLESGNMTLGYGRELGEASGAAAEAQRLRFQIEESEALLRQEDAFQRKQEATFALIRQSIPNGDGVLDPGSLIEMDAAEANYREAQAEVDGIMNDIRTGERR